MKKTTKLLSVILAFVMVLSSMTMMASAKKATYQTVANLNTLSAYSPYGTVTRLSTEERVSILFDFLDFTLGKKPSLNMGEVFNIIGISLSIDLTSVDSICATLDNVKDLKSGTLYGAAESLLNFGIIEDISMNNWTSGYTRAGKDQIAIIVNLCNLLLGNTSVITTVLTSGIDLGIIRGFLKGVNLGPINVLLKDLPGAVKKIVMPLFSRPDDTATLRTTYKNSSANLVTVAQNFVNGLFTKPMNWTSYRTDGSGNNLGYTADLPTQSDGTSRYYVISSDGLSITQYDYSYPGVTDSGDGEFTATVTYTRELEAGKTNVYIYAAPSDYTGDATLKYYKADGFTTDGGVIQSAYWVPSLKEAMDAGDISLEINGNDTVVDLIYDFAPYLFREMAVVVLNGYVKRAIAGAFDVEFTKIGDKGSTELANYLSANGVSDTFFTENQEYYIWEYSNYKVINGTPYYRWQDEFFVGKLPSNLSTYYDLINWDYEITDDFIDEFIPASNGATSAAGYTRILQGLNDFVYKVIDTVVSDDYHDAMIANWTQGDLSNAKQNILDTVRYVVSIAPEEIFGDYYYTAQFYDAMMTGSMSQAINGLVCELVKMVMPQMIFSTDIIDEPVTAILAVVVRELCTQLMPTYDFDAMIYSDYNTRTVLSSKTSDYWLDTSLYMGVNLGLYYLRNLADVGEDDATNGYYGAMYNLGVIPSNDGDAMTFTANSQYANGEASWLYMVDWIMDWALYSGKEWCWGFEKFVDLVDDNDDEIKISLTSYENPFTKINAFILSLLPFDELFNVNGLSGTTYGSETFLEKVLKDGLVDGIANLDFAKIAGLVDIPSGIFTSTNILDQIVVLVRDLLNTVLYKVAGNAKIVPTSITTVTTLLNQANIRTTVVNLVNKLYTAVNSKGVLVPIMPIAGFFVGWKTDPQTLAGIDVSLSNSEGYGYFYTSGTETLTVYNNSSGMLLKHRDSSVVDAANNITVKRIYSTDNTISCSTTNTTIAPYGSYTFTLSNSSTTARAVAIVVEYTVTAKDGASLGDTQYKQVYTYVSSTTPSDGGNIASQNIKKASGSSIFATTYCDVTIDARKEYYFVSSASEIENNGFQSNNSLAKATWVSAASQNTAAAAPLAVDYTSYVHGSSENATLKELGLGHWIAKQTILAVYSVEGPCTLYFNTVSDASALKSGTIYSGGKVNITLKSGNGTGNSTAITLPSYYYFDVSSLEALLAKCQDYREADFTDASAWSTFVTARNNAIQLVYQPKLKASFTSTYAVSNISAKASALEDAINALNAFKTVDIQTEVDSLQAALDNIETGVEDINFQNHKLFEYFKYEDQRTATRNMLKAFAEPEMPTSYIENESLSYAEIQAIISAQTNSNVALGIQNTLVAPSTDAMNAYYEAVSSWKQPGYGTVDVQNQEVLLNYYYQFLIAKAADKTFLSREITAAPSIVTAKADGNTPATYFSTDSWAAYQDALSTAQTVNANSSAEESEVFEAKYNLMVAIANLMPKFKSMKDNGYLDEEINALVAHANAIINGYGSIYSVKSGVTAAEAFAQLVKALGVEYENSYGDDAILYKNSALTYQEYDREQTAKNKSRVDDAADALRAAIENFDCTITLDAADAVTSVDQDIRFIRGITPGTITNIADLLTHVELSNNAASMNAIASKAGGFGTGAKVDVAYGGSTIATYFVVIYGDVNGDGSIDGFDALETAITANTSYYMGDVYDDAADINSNGYVDAQDYASIKSAVLGTTTIDQRG